MADTKKDTKKVKTDEKAAETIVDEVTAESADTAETTTTDVNVTETVDVPEEQAEAAKPKPVAKENRRGSKALREENDKLKERCQDAEDKPAVWNCFYSFLFHFITHNHFLLLVDRLQFVIRCQAYQKCV
mgnify:CR=1 FL=1